MHCEVSAFSRDSFAVCINWDFRDNLSPTPTVGLADDRITIPEISKHFSGSPEGAFACGRTGIVPEMAFIRVLGDHGQMSLRRLRVFPLLHHVLPSCRRFLWPKLPNATEDDPEEPSRSSSSGSQRDEFKLKFRHR